MTILTHHSNEAWDVFLTLPSHRQTTARKCNSVPVNSPGWRYNNEHKKAKVTLGILLPVYTLTGKIKWKTTSYIVRIIQIYTPTWVWPNGPTTRTQNRGEKTEEGENTTEQLPTPSGPWLHILSPVSRLTSPLLVLTCGLWPATAASPGSFGETCKSEWD